MTRDRRRLTAGVVACALILALVAARPASAAPAAPADPVITGGGLLTLPAGGQPTTVVGTNGVVYPADAQGRATVVHGFNIKQSDLSGVSLDQLAGIRQQGFNVLRLAVFWSEAEPQAGQWNEAYFAQVSQVLDWANQVGLSVVLDMHQDSFSTVTGGFGIPDWATRTDGLAVGTGSAIPNLAPGDQRAWQHLYEDQDLRQAQAANWLQFVTRFSSKPALYGYDLINEPFGQINPGESLPDAGRRVEATQLTAMEQRLTDAIRTQDTAHWILVEPLFALTSSLAEPGGLGAIADPAGRIIYAPHEYDLGMEAGTDWDPKSDFVTRYDTNIVSYSNAHHVPFLVFEWGPQQPALPNAPDYVQQVLAGIDRLAAGHAGFAWCKGLAGWCQLDGNGRPGAAMALTVAPYPTQVAGTPAALRTDPLAPRSTLTVAQPRTDQPTVFFVPASQFSGQPPVTVTGAPSTVTWDQAAQTVSVLITAPAASATIVVGDPEACATVEQPDAGTARDRAFVRLAYLELLGRCPDGGGAAYWTDRLHTGADSRAGVARYLASTPEADGLLVDAAYQQVLGRAPDPGGRAYWVGRQQTGQRFGSLLAELGASDELFAAGGSDGGSVDLLYQRLLGRSADADGRAYWVGQLHAGASRRSVAGRFAFAPEVQQHLVGTSNQQLLGRPATPAELTSGLASLQADGDLGHLRAGIAGTIAFEVRAQSFPNPG